VIDGFTSSFIDGLRRAKSPCLDVYSSEKPTYWDVLKMIQNGSVSITTVTNTISNTWFIQFVVL
jgi:hypothetical protein